MNAGSDYLEIQEKARLLIFKRFIHGVSLNLCCLPFAGDHSLSQGHRKSQSGTSFYPTTPNREVLQNADSWTASETLKHQKGQIHTYLIFFFQFSEKGLLSWLLFYLFLIGERIQGAPFIKIAQLCKHFFFTSNLFNINKQFLQFIW